MTDDPRRGRPDPEHGGEPMDDPMDEPDGARAAPGWPPREILAPFVLLAVSMRRAHGYLIEEHLRALGLIGIGMSTLYRTLRHLEREGYLESTWEPGPTGPARRVYTLTDIGRAWLDTSAAMLDAYRQTIDRFFGLYASAQRPGGTGRGPSEGEPSEPAQREGDHAP